MAELRPLPLDVLVTRALRELDECDSVFDLPRARFFQPPAGLDLSVRFHGRRTGTPFGPAAGPHSQMAQNLVLSWLAGARIVELKTVQVDDRLRIPRPCIDMRTVGYNVEWSQELRLEQSLEEYVKGAMLVEILRAETGLGGSAAESPVVWDLSVGYDLAGIRSPGVQAFLDGALDCSALVERLRGSIPARWRRLRDLDFPQRLSDTLTLSTFHGCPPDEIERIADWLMREKGLCVIVKLNPMLLGPEDTHALLHDALGYSAIEVPESAFERDTKWDQALALCQRLSATAETLGLGFGIKLTNTLIVQNRGEYLPPEVPEAYLSGAPLHVLAMELVRRFRAHLGPDLPISFSGGVDRKCFPDAVALGLVPVTVCSDLLRPGGYARGKGYLDELAQRMARVGARTVEEWVLRYPEGQAASSRSEAIARNTEAYVAGLTQSRRHSAERNAKPPRKIGSSLELFDCITCDKCIPVCPNDANFAFELPPLSVAIVHVRHEGGRWVARTQGELCISARHQIANFADLCNDCGNCDVFCPEDGGPYLVKPRFFGSPDDWRAFSDLDGFALEPLRSGDRLLGRCGGEELSLETPERGARVTYRGEGFELTFAWRDPLGTLAGHAAGEVDLTWAHVLRWMRDAVYRSDRPTWPALCAGR